MTPSPTPPPDSSGWPPPTGPPSTTPVELDDERRRRIIVIGLTAVVALLAVAVPVVVALISRSSSASFADSEVLSANRLGAASVDLEATGRPNGSTPTTGPDENDGADGTGGDDGDAVLSAANLAPGDVVSGQLELTNAGTTPLRYGIQAFTNGGVLVDWLRFELWPATGTCAPDQPGTRLADDLRIGPDLVTMLPLDGVAAGPTNVLQPGETVRWCLGAALSLEAGNEAQNARLDLTLRMPVEQLVEGS